MSIDLSKFKVIYDEKVLKAISLQEIDFGEDVDWNCISKKPKLIAILVINEDGNTIKSLTARYGLRYDEFIADIVATLQSQNIRIKELEKQLNK